jgi:hypothetical protein
MCEKVETMESALRIGIFQYPEAYTSSFSSSVSLLSLDCTS